MEQKLKDKNISYLYTFLFEESFPKIKITKFKIHIVLFSFLNKTLSTIIIDFEKYFFF